MRRGLRLREGLLGILVQVGHSNPRCELQKNHTGTFLHLALGEEGGNTCSATTRLCKRRRRERAAEGVESGSGLRLGAGMVAMRLEAAHEAVALEHHAMHRCVGK